MDAQRKHLSRCLWLVLRIGWVTAFVLLAFLPGGAPASSASGLPKYIVFRLETVSNNSSRMGSMVLGKDGLPQLAYEVLGPASARLHYARWDGTQWIDQDVDTLDLDGLGWIAVDSNNNPHISYAACNMYSCTHHFADWSGSQWELTSIMEGAGPLVLDDADTPHMVYSVGNVVGEIGLRYAYRQGGQWLATTLDSGLSDLHSFTIALDSQGAPRVAYYAHSALNYLSWTGQNWTSQLVETQTNMGLAASLALDAGDLPHLSYYDGNMADLRYTTQNLTGWTSETVDGQGDVGGVTALAMDSLGEAHIAYYDATHQAIKYARFNGHDWEIYTVESAVGDSSYFPISLVLDGQGLPRISYTTWDDAAKQYRLKVAWVEKALPYNFPVVMNQPQE